MKGAGVFVLDVISNTLGAMLLIFLLVAPKLLDRPLERREETLLVQARAADGQAVVRLWVQPPDSAERFFCDPADPARRDAFELTTVPQVFARAEEGVDRTGAGGNENEEAGAGPPAALWLRPAGPAGNRDRHACAILVRDPAPGCWSYGAVYSDHPQLEQATEIEVGVWSSGAGLIAEGDSSFRPATAEEGAISWQRRSFELHPGTEVTGRIVAAFPGGQAPDC